MLKIMEDGGCSILGGIVANAKRGDRQKNLCIVTIAEYYSRSRPSGETIKVFFWGNLAERAIKLRPGTPIIVRAVIDSGDRSFASGYDFRKDGFFKAKTDPKIYVAISKIKNRFFDGKSLVFTISLTSFFNGIKSERDCFVFCGGETMRTLEPAMINDRAVVIKGRASCDGTVFRDCLCKVIG